MLDLHNLASQFDEFAAFQAESRRLRAEKLRRAVEAFREMSSSWEAEAEGLFSEAKRALIAKPFGPPAEASAAQQRPTPCTVVATDGSQIYPDRHLDPSCYLLNISRIAFHYGTHERPTMAAEPRFKYRTEDVPPEDDELTLQTSEDAISALRDEYELRALLDTAKKARVAGRPLVALADGTLIRWMVRRVQDSALQEKLLARYAELLQGFRDADIPIASYVSLPASTEVVNLLRLREGEDLDAPPQPVRGAHPDEQSLLGLYDRDLYEAVLEPGERSVPLASASRVLSTYAQEDRICSVYACVPTREGGCEIGRIEMPRWVAEDDGALALVHAVVLSECKKGGGYPLILSEAHERAVIRASEKALFYQLIQQRLEREGLPIARSRKDASKRRPLL
jgi:hypothetical protein